MFDSFPVPRHFLPTRFTFHFPSPQETELYILTPHGCVRQSRGKKHREKKRNFLFQVYIQYSHVYGNSSYYVNRIAFKTACFWQSINYGEDLIYCRHIFLRNRKIYTKKSISYLPSNCQHNKQRCRKQKLIGLFPFLNDFK